MSWIDAVERVAHVQRAGDVRRRDRDRVVLVRACPPARGGTAPTPASARRSAARPRPARSACAWQVRHGRGSVGPRAPDGGHGGACERRWPARRRGHVLAHLLEVELADDPLQVVALALGQVARPAARALDDLGQAGAVLRGQRVPVVAHHERGLDQERPRRGADCGQERHAVRPTRRPAPRRRRRPPR